MIELSLSDRDVLNSPGLGINIFQDEVLFCGGGAYKYMSFYLSGGLFLILVLYISLFVIMLLI